MGDTTNTSTTAVAGYHCPCGTRYTLAAEEDREQYDQACADHDAYCSMAQAGMAEPEQRPEPSIATTLALAADLVQDAMVAGIEVNYASITTSTLSVFAADNALTAALAASAGVTRRDVASAPCSDGRYIETFTGMRRGVYVTVQGDLPASVVEAERAAVMA